MINKDKTICKIFMKNKLFVFIYLNQENLLS